MELVSTVDKAEAGSTERREYEPGRECFLSRIYLLELEKKVHEDFK